MSNQLSQGQVAQILELRDSNYPYRKIAELVGCSTVTVGCYCKPERREASRAWHKAYRSDEQHRERRNALRRVRRGDPEWVGHKRQVQASRLHNFKRKMTVISLLGGKCARCGEDDWRVLQVNHVVGMTKGEFPRSGAPLYRAIAAGKRSLEDLELLCANCNARYEYERGRLGEPIRPIKEVENELHSLVS